MLESACGLAAQGVAVHWLRPRSKAPKEDDWSTLPVNTVADLRGSWREGLNVGIRLGEWSKVSGLFLHVIDMDIRKIERAEEALAWLKQTLPEVDALPFVISGSGGASRHFYFLTDRPFRSRKIKHSDDKFTDTAGKQRWVWEIDLFGTGKQVACPPSIHPDTGKEYVWGRPIDFDMIEMDLGPIVPAETVQGWGVSAGDIAAEEDELLAEVHRRPLDIDADEVRGILADLPLDSWCEDREGWLTVGMALHHQYEGSKVGLEIWNTFSAKSAKYKAADQSRVWDSFKGRLVPVRMPTLIKAAGIARLERAHEGDDDASGFDELALTSDIEDLIGTPKSSDDIDAIGTEAPGPDKAWRQRLDLNDEGVIKPTLHNLSLIVRHDIRTKGIFQFNEFTQENVQRRTPGTLQPKRVGPKGVKQLNGPVWKVRDTINGDLWSDSKENSLRDLIEGPKTQAGYGIKVTDRDMKASVDMAAHEAPFHPIREFLEGLKWDGKPRAETLFIRFLGAEDNEYSRWIARLTLLGAVVRVYEPGHKFDFVPIFEGIQGKRKSTFIEILAKHWFGELKGDMSDSKKMIEKMQGAWILEIPELSSLGKTMVQEVKAFISAKHDKDRLAWHRHAERYERQCIFMGSTNDHEYLKDDTGGRRWWPLACTIQEIDTDGLLAEVDQVWAEALVLYREMRAKQPHGTLPLYLRDAAREEALRLQESRRIETAEEALGGQIGLWLQEPKRDPSGFEDQDDLLGGPIARDEVCLLELWVECLGRDRSHYKSPESQLLGRAMKFVPGWISVGRQSTTRYGQQRVYKRITSGKSDDLI